MATPNLIEGGRLELGKISRRFIVDSDLRGLIAWLESADGHKFPPRWRTPADVVWQVLPRVKYSVYWWPEAKSCLQNSGYK
jgi:hypothetical protein